MAMVTVTTLRRVLIVPFLAVLVLVAFGAFPSAQADTLLGTGSGFLITNQGLIVTNMHVIEGASRIEVQVPSLGRTVSARVVATDTLNDLALLRVASDSVRTRGAIRYRLAASSTVAVGQDAWTLGFPLGSIMGSTAATRDGRARPISVWLA
jgi:serine protease Do